MRLSNFVGEARAMIEKRDYYEVLGLERQAGEEEIKEERSRVEGSLA